MVGKVIKIIEIPNFITHVQLSKKQRAKYYKKGRKKELPKKYQKPEYGYRKKDGVLIHLKTGIPPIANPRVVGTPKIKKINGQDIYRGRINPHMRSKIVSEMKQFFEDKLRKQKIKPIPFNHYPLEMELEMHLPLNDSFDVDNAGWLYVKAIQDVLVSLQIIKNDVGVYLPKTGGVQYVPLEEGQTPNKLVIILRENITPYRKVFKKYSPTEKQEF